jgi:peptidoglycan/xylan/chitin deacetylase (PgdA/CDA1 family)
MIHRFRIVMASALQVLLVGLMSVSAQVKEVAVTIDDLPLNGPNIGIVRLGSMTDKLLAGLNKSRIPAVGFVNESLLYVPGETDARIDLLKKWMDGGVELGNHTFSHLGFKTATLNDYEDDFMRGEAVTRMLMRQRGQKPRYFRHPFLQMGNTLDVEKSFESFIGERGYKIAPVTIDSMDWMFLAAYANAKADGDAATGRLVAEEYIKYVGKKLDFCDKTAVDLTGRSVKHILLLHANELNADNFDALVKVFKDHGFRFITLEQALADPFYKFPDTYQPISDWLGQWAFSKGKKLEGPQPPESIQKAYSDAQKKVAVAK